MLSRFQSRTEARLFLALGITSAILSFTAVAGSLAAIGRTFPGFVVWDDLVVVALGRPAWSGMQAKVPFRARVVRADGEPVHTRADVNRLVHRAPPGTPHRFDFAGRRGEESRWVLSRVFGAEDWAATLGVYAVNGLAFLLIGFAVFWMKPDSPQSRALLAFSVIWGLALLLAVDLFTAGRLQSLYFILEALAPASILHLALRFPESRLAARPGIVPAAYALALVVGLVQLWAFPRSYGVLLAVNDAVYLAIAATGLTAIASIAVSAVAGGNPLARRRAWVVLAGAVTAFGIPLVSLLAFFVLGQPVSFSLLTLTGFLFPLSIGYAIARHDLFDADRFVKLSVVYAALTALVSLAYGSTVLLVDRLAAGLALRESPLFPTGFVLLVLVTIVPLRDRVQRAVDRLLYRGRVDYKGTVAEVSERLTTLFDREAIVRLVVRTLEDVVFLERVRVWERDDVGLVRRGEPGPAARVPPGDPGLAVLQTLGRPLSRDEVAESPRLRPERPALHRLLEKLDASLVVPLLREGRLTGVLAVGGKASGGSLSADDVDVLRTLANDAALALSNAEAVEQLHAAREQLARAERLAAMGELSAAVAHGIRNPLAGIRLAAQVGLESAGPNEAVRESLTDVIAEVDRLEEHVRGILDFARPFEPRLEPVDLAALLRDLVATLAPRLETTRVTVGLALPPGLPPVLGDAAHLQQAFEELLVNAMQAMQDGGHVTISASDGAGQVRVAVADDGPGIPPGIRDRVFQLFMTTKSTGSGVGLAVVRKVVERHGGTVSVREAVGRGACFIVALPAVRHTPE